MRHWFLGLAAIIVSAGVAAADDKAAEVVKKGIEAHGGAEALNKYTAARFTMKGEVDVQGTATEFSGDMAQSGTDKLRMNLSLDVMGMRIAINQVMIGDKLKRTIKVGDNTVDGGSEEKDEIKMAHVGRQIQFMTPLLDAKKFTIRASDDEDVNGKKASVVVATPKTIDREVKLYFDKESGLLVKTGAKGLGPDMGGSRPEVYKESYSSEFKKVNGVQVSTKTVQHHDGKKFMTITMADYEMLEKLDDSEFKISD